MKKEEPNGPLNIYNLMSKIGIMLVCLSLTVVSGCGKRKGSGSVRLYTSVPGKIIEEVKLEFEAKHPGITLDIFRTGTAKVMERIRKEVDMGNLGADVVWVADFSAAEELKKRDSCKNTPPPRQKI